MHLILVAVQILNRLPTFLCVYLAARTLTGVDARTIASISLIFASSTGWLSSSLGVALVRRFTDHSASIFAPRDVANFAGVAFLLFPSVSSAFLYFSLPGRVVPWDVLACFSIAFFFAILAQSMTLCLIKNGRHRACLLSSGLSATIMGLGLVLPISSSLEVGILLAAAAAGNFTVNAFAIGSSTISNSTPPLVLNDFGKLLLSNFLSVWTNTICILTASNLADGAAALALIAACFQWQQAITMLPQSSAMTIMSNPRRADKEQANFSRSRKKQIAKLSGLTLAASLFCFFVVPLIYGKFDESDRTALAVILLAGVPYTMMAINGAHLVAWQRDSQNLAINFIWGAAYLAITATLVAFTSNIHYVAAAYLFAYCIAATVSELLVKE